MALAPPPIEETRRLGHAINRILEKYLNITEDNIIKAVKALNDREKSVLFSKLDLFDDTAKETYFLLLKCGYDLSAHNETEKHKRWKKEYFQGTWNILWDDSSTLHPLYYTYNHFTRETTFDLFFPTNELAVVKLYMMMFIIRLFFKKSDEHYSIAFLYNLMNINDNQVRQLSHFLDNFFTRSEYRNSNIVRQIIKDLYTAHKESGNEFVIRCENDTCKRRKKIYDSIYKTKHKKLLDIVQAKSEGSEPGIRKLMQGYALSDEVKEEVVAFKSKRKSRKAKRVSPKSKRKSHKSKRKTSKPKRKSRKSHKSKRKTYKPKRKSRKSRKSKRKSKRKSPKAKRALQKSR